MSQLHAHELQCLDTLYLNILTNKASSQSLPQDLAMATSGKCWLATACASQLNTSSKQDITTVKAMDE